MDKQAKSVSGTNENYDEMYSIAAEIFTQLVKDSAGDAKKMKVRLDQAKQNPRAFAAEIAAKMPKVRERIRLLSHSIQNSGTPINTEVKVPDSEK